jgi:hypothetical protein
MTNWGIFTVGLLVVLVGAVVLWVTNDCSTMTLAAVTERTLWEEINSVEATRIITEMTRTSLGQFLTVMLPFCCLDCVRTTFVWKEKTNRSGFGRDTSALAKYLASPKTNLMDFLVTVFKIWQRLVKAGFSFDFDNPDMIGG